MKSTQETPMVSDEIGLKLHDRGTTGDTLTSEEQAHLIAWYAAKDQAEALILNSSKQPLPDITAIQDEINQTLAQLATSIQQLQIITQGNNVLRQENADLKQQLDNHRPNLGILR